jgi:pimeloyl-ACP methyl ester carboxylesterase
LVAAALSATVIACSSDGEDATDTTAVTSTADATQPGATTTALPTTTEPATTNATDTSAAPDASPPPPDTQPAVTEPVTTAPPATEPATSATEPAEEIPLVAPPGEAFYVAPDPLPGDEPGDVIWTRELTNVPDGSRGWLVLYRSTSVAGDPIPVSGMVFAPASGEADAVLSWAHGTTGLADDCAPSWNHEEQGGYTRSLAQTAVSNNWTLVATDYEGLGTEGVHPYLVGISEGRGVLDIVRAASQIDGSGVTPDEQVLISGHSQGGHASLMAGDIAPEYAPELDIVGTVAIAPAGELPLIESTLSGMGGGGAGGFALMALAGFLDAYPDLPVEAVADEAWRPLLEQVGDTCLNEAFGLASGLGPRPNGTLDPQWNAVLEENSPGRVEPEAPILIVHGDADDTVPAALSDIIHNAYCGLGATSQRNLYAGADHISILGASAEDIDTWMKDRLAGSTPPSSCPTT